MAANVCQYWSIDSDGNPIEPGLCPNWDVTNAICTFTEKKTNADGDEVTDSEGNPVEVKDSEGNLIRASFYPHCNLVGTQAQCNQYAGTGTQKRCIVPDHSRHVVNRRTGKKWATKSVIEEGKVTTPADYSAITEYNDGRCDGFGTATKCTAYSSYIMGFSSLQPDDKDGTKKADEDGVFTTISGFDVRLPLSHEVYNKRADLGRCYWWQADNEDFTAESSLDSPNFGKVNTVTFRCTNPDEIVQNYSGDVGNGFKWDFDLHMNRSPCNGAKPECPRYTSGICWQYCIDEKMRLGDKVLAEQVLELRYHIRKEKWEEQKFKDSFIEPYLYAWDGTVSVQSDDKYLIPAHRTYINDFDTFEIKHDKAMLTEGTVADDYRKKYPDLVRELKDIVLAPIIRNRFDNKDIHGEDLKDIDGESLNIFESSDIDHNSVLIFGDMFWHNSETYAFNIDDPELNFPSHVAERLKEHMNMSEIEAKLELSSGAVFDEFYDELECILDFIIDAMPDKMPASEFGSDQNMFYIDAPSRWGDNNIFVFNKGSGRWEFDKIYFKKIYVGGIIGQTGFSLSGDGEIDYLPDYGSDFSAYLNDNGSVSFSFFPLINEERGDYGQYLSYYMYLDGVRDRLSANPSIIPDNKTYELTYRLYKVTVGSDIELDIKNTKFFGNAGYALVVIPDEVDETKVLSYVIKPWEVEGKLEIVHVDDDGNETGREEMIIYESCNDRMEVNQFIIRPKDINNFNSFCKNDYLSIKELVTYERRTLENPLGGEEELESFIDEDDSVSYRENFVINATDNLYTIRKFGYEPLMVSIVFRGITGRIKGHVKTKLITWIRQPFCRDVEIKYAWNASYEYATLLPEYNCYIREGEQAGKRVDPDPVYKGYTPPCGDHDLSFNSGLGPMWYPYVDCNSYDRYNITGNLSEWDIRIMEVFWEDWSDPPHGSHDIRMLGPADSFGETCDSHASLWNCLCDWSYCNSTKKTENLFTGYGRYRGGVTGLDKVKMLQNSGASPKFGNTYRDFMRSYRSMDNIDYYVVQGTSFIRKRKWVPINEFYASASITNPTSSYPYLMYCSNDFYDDTSSFMHQFGFLTVNDTIEGVQISESMEMAALVAMRYDFDEVFRTHSSLAGLYYPFPKDPYYRLINSVLVPIITWYTYKDYPEGDLSKSIQWAWQELWGELERYDLNTSDRTCASYTYIGDHPTIDNSTLMEEKLVTPQRKSGDDIIGRHIYFNVEHPDYKYDYMLGEHRLVCDEGDQVLWLTAPVEEGIGNYGDDPIWSIKLNSGPKRCFDLDGVWADGIGCNKTLYDTCTTSPWVTEVTLFDTGFTSTTPDADRTITTYDSIGDEVLEYYQRGLDVTIRSGMLKYLPRSAVLLNSEDYEIKLDKLADCMTAGEKENNNWASLEDLTEFYPAEYNLNLKYCDGSNELNIDMKLANDMSIGAVSIDFGLGAEEVEGGTPNTAESIFLGDLYHLPGVTIYKSADGISFTEISKVDSMFLSGSKDTLRSVRGFYDIAFNVNDIKSPYQYLRIKIRLKATTEEINAKGNLSNYYNKSGVLNQVHIQNVYVYYNRFEDSTEDITTWERKYNISVGKHGDFPPHGADSTGSLLYVIPKDRSTVYQYDSIGGVVGMPSSAGNIKTMNKSRGRILFETHSDKEAMSIGVGGGLSWLYKAEEEQKNIYDAIINEGETSFSLTSVAPPSLDSKLLEIGITFPAWGCSFHNSVVRPLKSVDKQGTYSPCGHLFIADYKNIEQISNCGKHGSIFWRSTENVFEYVFQHKCTGTLNWSIDVFTAWENGMGAVLTNPMGYIGPELARNEEVANRINASEYGSVTMQLAGSVASLN